MRIGKKLRDLVLRQSETFVFSRNSCDYMGERYSYTPVTKEEVQKTVNHLLDLINPKKHWWEVWK